MLVVDTAERFRQLLANNPALKTPNMNQQCKVCNEPAAGFHFGAFTCEGCKAEVSRFVSSCATGSLLRPFSTLITEVRHDRIIESFFGRTYNNLSSISECKNNGECVINKKNRTSCKACRLRKCLMVGMSKSGSRYGRRSNWFKIHCLLQEQGGLPPVKKEEPEEEEPVKERRYTPPFHPQILHYPRQPFLPFQETWSPRPPSPEAPQDQPIDLSLKPKSEAEVLDLTKRQALTG